MCVAINLADPVVMSVTKPPGLTNWLKISTLLIINLDSKLNQLFLLFLKSQVKRCIVWTPTER